MVKAQAARHVEIEWCPGSLTSTFEARDVDMHAMEDTSNHEDSSTHKVIKAMKAKATEEGQRNAHSLAEMVRS